MSELKISEAGSVQSPMVAHATGVGWTPIPALKSPNRSAVVKWVCYSGMNLARRSRNLIRG